LTLQEIAEAMSSLPDNRTPNQQDWAELSASWRPRLDAHIAMLERLRDRLDSCIGCGCLSLKRCSILNPGDVAAERGPGPRYLIEAD
jgi:MerR family redox-sensitive transcriptional activator SoxR